MTESPTTIVPGHPVAAAAAAAGAAAAAAATTPVAVSEAAHEALLAGVAQPADSSGPVGAPSTTEAPLPTDIPLPSWTPEPEDETGQVDGDIPELGEDHFEQEADALEQEIVLGNDEQDSSYGDDDASLYFESVTPSVYCFPSENGRTYHSYERGKYLVPNDEQEKNRMDMVYHALTQMFKGRLFFAPVENPQMIVDMGTGTGIWTMDVGDNYPEAHVIGIDLSPIQPKWVPPNVEFRVDDLEKEWLFDQPIDLVHSRLCSGNAIRNWPHYLSEAYRCLKPGGWVEAQEFDVLPVSDDNSFPPNSAILEWHHEFRRGFLVAGCEMSISSAQLKAYMVAAGFVNVHSFDYKWPLSPWNEEGNLKEAGGFAMLSMLDDLSGLSLACFTRFLGWEVSQMEIFLARVRKEWRCRSVHGYWPLFVVCGQKPH